MTTLKADQARAIADSKIKSGDDIKELREYVDKRITEAALSGKKKVFNPAHGLRSIQSNEQFFALWKSLEKDGFEVTHHPDPDPGHPASGPFTTVEW